MLHTDNGKKPRIGFLNNLKVHQKPAEEEPLRSEVFSVEQMHHHSKILAETHKAIQSHMHRDRLLTRLVDNELVLREARDGLTEAAMAKRRIIPAADWLLDNFYLIEEHIDISKRDLPKGYSRGLPRLVSGKSEGLPRVYDLALERISHGDGLVDPKTILGFLDSYQSVSVLTLGELWAIPIMLRLALIENLRRVAVRISTEMRSQNEADSWAERMTTAVESDPKNLILVIAEMARSDPPMINSFVAELARKLQGKGAALALPLTWIEERLSEAGLTIDQLIQSAMRQQAADQVSISNSIRGLRSLGAMDWERLVESTSIVEKILRSDPAKCYSRMDFATRDRYRHMVEKTARRGRLSEEAVANIAVQLAREGLASAGKDDRQAHVGYYLIDKGFPSLLRAVHLRPSLLEKSCLNGYRSTLGLFLGSIGLMSVVVTISLLMLAYGGGIRIPLMWTIVFPSLVCTAGLSIAFANLIATTYAEPHILPRMDYSEGIPAGSRTLVVVPSMLVSNPHVVQLVDDLEVRFLANRGNNVFFGLLTDFQDCKSQTAPEDILLLRQIEQQVARLNEQYEGKSGNPFFLFHRPRLWNASEQMWMGYERKRGKLAELNALLQGGPGDGFQSIIGDRNELKAVKYVITLDTDTQLPRDSVSRLAGIMAHPLNHAVFDQTRKLITEGHCILQPRIVTSLSGAHQSLYAKLNDSEPGIDPYTRAVSDVYQDLFDEGSFMGKGIYEVASFECVLQGRFPENRILSHDLLEGCYARSGFASDVQLYEESPAGYHEEIERRRRWIRGDWQIARWIFKTVPTFYGGSRRNVLSALSKWKILDNLRRSIQAPAFLFLFVLGWIGIRNSLPWTLALVGILLIPTMVISFIALCSKPLGMPLLAHLGSAAKAALIRLAQVALTMACLPYEAVVNLATIMKTAWRMLFARRNLLAWKPSGEHDRTASTSLFASFRIMWIAPLFAAGIFVVLFILRPAVLGVAMPLLAIWFASPFIVWIISRPSATKDSPLASSQYEYLGSLARKTWSFFEFFVNENEHWLPPDNFQEVPVAKVAHRTSPTNIGLALLANMTAYDLGYQSMGLLLERTDHTMQSMMKLERYRNHLYNWYDTQTLQPLAPRYVSTVDSGNLSAHLLAFGAGISLLSDEKILGKRFWTGLGDTVRILASLLDPGNSMALAGFNEVLERATEIKPESLSDAYSLLKQLAVSANTAHEAIDKEVDSQRGWWMQALIKQVRDAVIELEFFIPWLPRGIVLDVQMNSLAVNIIPSLRELMDLETEWLRSSKESSLEQTSKPAKGIHGGLDQLVRMGLERAVARIATIGRLENDIKNFGHGEYSFLYSKRRNLLAIGYDVEGHRRDPGYYDLLASEARIASFVAIAQEEIPQKNWFALGRLLAEAGGKSLLFSWSGSMFEYLMPLLVMPADKHTLLGQTCKAAVARQIEYGRQRGVPWGISESGYNSFDVGHNYRYHAFGVPGLGLKRGLVNDLVIAPYASALALMVMPEKACANLQRLSSEGFEGDYGLYEAIDYTESRVPAGQTRAIVRSYMAHHQAMSLVSLGSLLLDQPMQRRFQSIPQVRSCLLLLEEKIPRSSRLAFQAAEVSEFRAIADKHHSAARVYTNPNMSPPAVHILSNGRYHVMVTNTGSGYSRWNELAVTRWVENNTADNRGIFLYIQDVLTGESWSNSYQPTLKRPDVYEAIFSEGRAEIRRRDHDLVTYTEIAVSPENDIELRRIRIENQSRVQRTVEVTSYAEVVLATPASDEVHPCFSNLFIQTEILEEKHAILCTRRPRSYGAPVCWMLHLMTVRDAQVLDVTYETDRRVFIGRGNTVVSPMAMKKPGPLAGNSGSVLDPIVAIRQRIIISPGSTAMIDLITGISDTREIATSLVDRYQDKRFANRAFELAQTHSQVILQQINGSEAEAQLYSQLASSILYLNSALRAESSVIIANRRGQSGLWGHSISGDIPVVLLSIKEAANIDLVRQLVQAHAYWRHKGLAVDLVIWNEERGGYHQQLHNQILGLITANAHASVINRSGGIFVRSAEQIAMEDRTLIQAVARVSLSDSRGTLEAQIGGQIKAKLSIPALKTTRALKMHLESNTTVDKKLLFPNGYGGFSPDGKEYVITLPRGMVTPAPWTNILANPNFGTVVSEAGMAYTWSENAHEFRLTPWHNDPVSDTSGEAIYIRDEKSGSYWSPTPLPRKGDTPYVSRHGFGYSAFEHSEQGITTELWIYVAKDAPVKFSSLRIRNESGRSRKLSVTSFAQLVLGELPSKSAMHIVTGVDQETGALFARNRYSTEFSDRVVFMDAIGAGLTMTCDRAEFVGQNGTMENPAAMSRARLSGKTGAALDPCVAIQIPFKLADGQSCEFVFRLGSGRDTAEAVALVKQYRVPGSDKKELEEVLAYWNRTLSTIQVDTPDASIDVLANGWLLYQVLSSRLWGRSGYYQSGGAFGFRDQLQDAMSLVHAEPGILRSQILLCASRQFPEGDVQHWWHPPAGRGSRTHCSDDYLWLPLATYRYIESTGDRGILDQGISFIEGRPVESDEESYYDLPETSRLESSLYDHCVRAIMNGAGRGKHGLPLIGSGDWNDGMNKVGEKGEGESVWLAFFQYEVLTKFSTISLLHGDHDFNAFCLSEAERLQKTIDAHGWDGSWYRRAYFDDGSPLGSAGNAECQIDSLCQSWSVLSGAGAAERSRIAMNSMYKHLVDHEEGLVQLLTPPFEKAMPNPGYIQGYVQGVRENGGQYTHAAIWAIMAFAKMGNHERAWQLFNMINPVNHTKKSEGASVYMVEPYVMSADVYSGSPHGGRGGWTWYTGAAAWTYRLLVESLLGITLESDHLRFAPCLPDAWTGFTVHYRYKDTIYHIVVKRSQFEASTPKVVLDGISQAESTISLVDDLMEHQVEVLVSEVLDFQQNMN